MMWHHRIFAAAWMVAVSPLPALSARAQAASPIPARVPSVGTDGDIRQRIAAYVDYYARKEKFSGAVLVARNGSVLFHEAYGRALGPARNPSEHTVVPNTLTTPYAIFSITKSFTAAAILLLQERKQLNVQDPVSKYVPDWPTEWQTVTLHQLLTHTSGIKPESARQWLTERERAKSQGGDKHREGFSPKPLASSSTGTFHYLNFGYEALGEIVERVSGRSYADFMQENVFTPLQMTHSHCNTEFMGAGNIASTADDLWKWDQALYGDTLLSLESRNALFAPLVSIPADDIASVWGEAAKYGYGWVISRHRGSLQISHTGSGGGSACLLERYPEDRICIVILSSFRSYPQEWSADALADLARGQAVPIPGTVAVPDDLLKEYVGDYQRVTDKVMIRITRKQNRLYYRYIGDPTPAHELIPLSGTLFGFHNIRVEFARNESGSGQSFTYHNGSLSVEARKIK